MNLSQAGGKVPVRDVVMVMRGTIEVPDKLIGVKLC
jgi:hypothetical protein